MFTSKDRVSQMQPSCLILEDVDEPRSGFDGVYSNGKPTGQVPSSQANVYSSLLSGLDAPYLSISPMLALSDSFEPRSDEDETIDLNLDGNFQYRHQHQAPTTFPGVIDSDIRDCLSPSTDQCNSFDQMNNNHWNELQDHVPEFLKYAADAIIDDDLFINPKSGSCADPTLAELNANPKCMFDDLPVLDDLPLSEECSQFKFPTLPTTPQDSQDALVLPAITSGRNTPMHPVPIGQTQFLPNLGMVKVETAESPLRRSTLHELLLQDNCPINNNCSNNNNSGSNNSSPCVVTEVVKEERIQSPPPNSVPPVSAVPNYVEENLFRSELTVPCTKRRQRTSTISSTCSSACDSHPGTSLDISQGFENECKRDYGSERRDSESNYDFSDSDGDDSIQSNDHSDDDRIYEVNRPRTRHFTSAQDSKTKRRNKRGRYFWQYNLQAKGPKGNRLPLATEFTNPHKLEQVTDPVFSPRCIIKGIKHTGKARKGDGNDLTPNPDKLHQIGQSLKSLSQIINDLTPVNELPVNVRPKSRKEKNKLASRVCRLKKKAQHEANKLKLYGLQQEHGHLIHILKEMKRQYKEEGQKKARELFQRCKEMENQMLKVRVAGRTVEFVNDVLDKVAVGIPQGGLDDL